MKKQLLFSGLLFLASFNSAWSQQSISWQYCHGGTADERGRDGVPTSDGGYIQVGLTNSDDGDLSANQGTWDYWVLKMNGTGVLEWQTNLGGSDMDEAWSVEQTKDGGYIVAGRSESTDGDVTGQHGNFDFWVVKLDALGNLEWENALGGTKEDYAHDIIQTTDSGYVVVGTATSTNNDVTGHNGGVYDMWVVRLDKTGAIIWKDCFGGSDADYGEIAVQTSDGGFLLGGTTASNDGDISGNHGNWDFSLIRLDTVGNLLWQKCYGGTGYETLNDVQQTTDGGFIIAGRSDSDDGDVSSNNGSADYWIVKTDTGGNITWEQSFGGSQLDEAYHIRQTTDQGFIATGHTGSFDGDIEGGYGGIDIWTIKLSTAGVLEWGKIMGGTGTEEGRAVYPVNVDEYVVFGRTGSTDEDVSGYVGGDFDFWIAYLVDPPVGVAEKPRKSDLSVYPNPSSGQFTIDLGSNLEVLEIIVTDATGREVLRSIPEKGSGYDFNLNAQDGIYFLNVVHSTGRSLIRLVKN